HKNIGDVIEFYGFFANKSTFVTTRTPSKGVDKTGMITIESLQNFIKYKSNIEMKSKLTAILAQRSWDEEKEIQSDGIVEIQIGAYRTYYKDFSLYLYNNGKINKNDFEFLQSLKIYSKFNGRFYLYRTKTTIDKIVKIKKAVYFDNPFIVTKK
ncbi:MAG: hypothetical protein KAI79_16735, partial [Bacteroidales bacterium]|nr:hypothetical protein [Bacteroidales bacterium]